MAWRGLLLNGFLALAVVLSALAVVYVKYQGRKLFVQLESQRRERDALDVEWRSLQLESSTLATNVRVEGIARKSLHMRMPSQNEIIVVKP